MLAALLSVWVPAAAQRPTLSAGSGGAAAAAATEQTATPAATGAIAGLVRWAGGPVPPPVRVRNTTDPDVCGEVHEIRRVRVSPAGGLADVIVAVVGELPAGSEQGPPPGEDRLRIDNVDCRFRPHVAVLTVGGTVETVNRDPMLHTVHFYGAVHENLALPGPGTRAQVQVGAPGLLVLLCDVHGWMRALVRVDPHPLHAVTDEDGRFRINGVPAGRIELEFWHEVGGTVRRAVTVRPRESTHVEVGMGSPPAGGGA